MFTLGPHEVIVGLGSNDSNALDCLRRARTFLKGHPLLRLVHSAPIYQSEALLPPHAPPSWNQPYLNSACLLEIHWDLNQNLQESAEKLLDIFKNIEKMMGRSEGPRWGPRPIDLDILVWGSDSVSTDRISIPHVELLNRPFALLPALDCQRKKQSHGPVLNHEWRWAHSKNVPFQTQWAPLAWPEIVGILNLTPDSFSDGQENAVPSKMSESHWTEILETRVEALLNGSATVIDVGAESTRPGALKVSEEEECRRLVPALDVLFCLKKKRNFKISLDSRHLGTIARILAQFPQLDWVNDVCGFESSDLVEVVKGASCDLVMMHSLGIPPSAELTLDPQQDPVDQLLLWGHERMSQLSKLGIDSHRIIFDPGLGFGKTVAQNRELSARVNEFQSLGTRLLMGPSRKSFLDPHKKYEPKDRDLETALIVAPWGSSGVDYVRVHQASMQQRALVFGS